MTPILENHMENQMENEMETVVSGALVGDPPPFSPCHQSRVIDSDEIMPAAFHLKFLYWFRV